MELEYECLRIPYIDKDGRSRTYIADFLNKSKDVLYEIKPKKEYLIQKYKMDRVIEYCMDNDIKFMWINEENILDYINERDFIDDNLIQYEKMKRGINAKIKNKKY